MPNSAGGFFITDVRPDEEGAGHGRKWSLGLAGAATRPETVTIQKMFASSSVKDAEELFRRTTTQVKDMFMTRVSKSKGRIGSEAMTLNNSVPSINYASTRCPTRQTQHTKSKSNTAQVGVRTMLNAASANSTGFLTGDKGNQTIVSHTVGFNSNRTSNFASIPKPNTAIDIKRELIKSSLKGAGDARQRAKSITKIMVETGDFQAQRSRVNYL